ncbi:MAG: DUF2334 domain-containing protein [Fibrobacteria bacterium]
MNLRPRALSVISALALGLPAAPAQGAPRPGAIVTVGLRYDDCAATSPEDLESRILAACARTGVPVTFGVVPEIGTGDNHDPAPAGNASLPQARKDMLAAARAQGNLEIALHGYEHKAFRLGARSEFAGADPARQNEIIAKGKAELEAFAGPVRTFIPPWNAYDRNTLRALAGNGFTAISAYADGVADDADGMAEAAASPGNGARARLRYAPATCLIPDLRAAVAAARAQGGGIIVPYFHPYEFKDVDSLRGFFTMAEFDSALSWLASQTDVQTLTLGEIALLPAGGTETYRDFSRWARLAPPFLEKPIRPAFRVYSSAAFPGKYGSLRLRLLVGAWYAFLAGAAFAAAALAKSRVPRRRHLGLALLALGAALGIGGAWEAAFPAASLGAGLLGFGMGLSLDFALGKSASRE